MIVAHSLEELGSISTPLHLALGVFDGLHIGHQTVIGLAVESARHSGGIPGVLTFEPHPMGVLVPERRPLRIFSSLEKKLEIIESLGVEVTYVQNFTKEFAATEAQDFIRELAERTQKLESISVGEDWHFGKGRSGNVETLREWGQSLSFEVKTAAAVKIEGERVSSTRIRKDLAQGKLKSAELMLGRHYQVQGRVLKGRQLARQMGTPTANIEVENELLPPDGVWQVLVRIDGKWRHGIANLGVRPSVETSKSQRLLEVHVFDYQGDLYDLLLEVEFGNFVRGEKVFSSISELKDQIHRDIEKVRAMNSKEAGGFWSKNLAN